MHVALQGKLLRSLMKEDGVLWRRMIKAEFGTNGRGWFTRALSRPHGKGLWKKIRTSRDKFQVSIRWKVGKGDKVRLWQDSWLEDGALRDQYPHIFVMAQQKDFMISDCYREGWHFIVLRIINNWEIYGYEKLPSTLYLMSLDESNNDPVWCLTTNESFSVKVWSRKRKSL